METSWFEMYMMFRFYSEIAGLIIFACVMFVWIVVIILDKFNR